MAWRKESQWFGPLRIIIQEDKNIICVVLGNKLYRLALEHARLLSAIEEIQLKKQANTPSMKDLLE